MVDKTVQETLKNEGQLVRNTGTNSIKSVKEKVNINTEKLEGILSTISDKMSSQIDLMERMVNLREVEIESAIEQRQDLLRQQNLEDVSTASATSGTTEDGQSKEDKQPKESEFKLPGIGSIFGGIFALGAGIPLFYKFVEGFFDEKYKERPEANPFNIVENSLEQFNELDIQQITTDFSKLSDALTNISSVLQAFADKTKEFLEKSWWEQFTTVITSSIGAVGAALFAIRFATRTLLGKGIVGKALTRALTSGALGAGAGTTASRGLSAVSRAAGFSKFLKFLGPIGVGATALEGANILREAINQQNDSLDQLYSIYPDAQYLNRGEGIPPSQASYYLEQSERDPDFVPDLIERQKEEGVFETPRGPKLETDVPTYSDTEELYPLSQRFVFEEPTEDMLSPSNVSNLSNDEFLSKVDEELEGSRKLSEESAELISDTNKFLADLADDQDNGQRLSFNLDQISQPEASAFGMGLGNVLRFGDNITGGSTIRQGDVYNNINNYTVDPTIPLHLGKSRAN